MAGTKAAAALLGFVALQASRPAPGASHLGWAGPPAGVPLPPPLPCTSRTGPRACWGALHCCHLGCDHLHPRRSHHHLGPLDCKPFLYCIHPISTAAVHRAGTRWSCTSATTPSQTSTHATWPTRWPSERGATHQRCPLRCNRRPGPWVCKAACGALCSWLALQPVSCGCNIQAHALTAQTRQQGSFVLICPCAHKPTVA